MLVNLYLKQKLQEHYKEYAFFAEMEGRSEMFMTSWWNMKNGTQKRKLARIDKTWTVDYGLDCGLHRGLGSSH